MAQWIVWFGVAVAVVGLLAYCHQVSRTVKHYGAYKRDLQHGADCEVIAGHSRGSTEMLLREKLWLKVIAFGVALSTIATLF